MLKVFAVSLAAASVVTALVVASASDAHATIVGNPSSAPAAGDSDVHATALNLTVGEYVELDFLPSGYGFDGARYRVTAGVIAGVPEVAETVQLSTFDVLDSAGRVANSVVEVFWINPKPTTARPR